MTPGEQVAQVPSDGQPRQLAAGWFVAYQVDAVDHALAVMQGRIAAKSNGLRPVDVVGATLIERADWDPQSQRGRWRVELQIEAPGRELGL